MQRRPVDSTASAGRPFSSPETRPADNDDLKRGAPPTENYLMLQRLRPDAWGLGKWSFWGKTGLVAGGYAAAVVTGMAAAWAHDRWLAAQPYDTSGGMYAAGVTMTGLGAFLLVALAPTMLALWFVRGSKRLWNVVALLSLAFALFGLLGAAVMMSLGSWPSNVALVLLAVLGLVQLLGVPLWTAAFVLFVFLAPTLQARRMLAAAVATEIVIGGCAFIHWFVRPNL